jgi:formylglycine-generating enzyme required for sulfatase activity
MRLFSFARNRRLGITKFRALLTGTVFLVAYGLSAEEVLVAPPWDGRESPQAYANRIGMPYYKQVKLDGGCVLDFVLIPAGNFSMGVMDAKQCQEEWPIYSLALAAVSLAGLLVCLFYQWLLARIRKSRPQFGLLFFITMVLLAGTGLGGGVRFYQHYSVYREQLRAANHAFPGESPQHRVRITHPFYITPQEISQSQYILLMHKNPSKYKNAVIPVHNVNYVDASEFCFRVSDASNCEVRLPTEAEWEYACRSGTTGFFHFGNSLDEFLRVADFDCPTTLPIMGPVHQGPYPVGSGPMNAFGLYDMHTNVSEWCYDGPRTYSHQEEADPVGPTNRPYRCVRGGNWSSDFRTSRSAFRSSYHFLESTSDIGFRVVLRESGVKDLVPPHRSSRTPAPPCSGPSVKGESK